MIRWAAQPGDGVIDISDTSSRWHRLHPRCQVGGLRVPGTGMTSETVDGVIEGLKLVSHEGARPRINFAYFSGPYRARELHPGDRVTGVLHHGRSIGLPQARVLIWAAVYDELLTRDAALARSIETAVTDRRPDPSIWASPEDYSAAGYLVAWLNGKVTQWAEGFRF